MQRLSSYLVFLASSLPLLARGSVKSPYQIIEPLALVRQRPRRLGLIDIENRPRSSRINLAHTSTHG
jgi:hypothetical protein